MEADRPGEAVWSDCFDLGAGDVVELVLLPLAVELPTADGVAVFVGNGGTKVLSAVVVIFVLAGVVDSHEGATAVGKDAFDVTLEVRRKKKSRDRNSCPRRYLVVNHAGGTAVVLTQAS